MAFLPRVGEDSEWSVFVGLWCPLPTTSMAQANVPGSAGPRDSPGVWPYWLSSRVECSWGGEDLFAGGSSKLGPHHSRAGMPEAVHVSEGRARVGVLESPVGSRSLGSALAGGWPPAGGGVWVPGPTGQWASRRWYCPPRARPGDSVCGSEASGAGGRGRAGPQSRFLAEVTEPGGDSPLPPTVSSGGLFTSNFLVL